MISVENFYWILYKKLLEPCRLDCRYYYPFGTTENLSMYEFHENHGASRYVHHHVMFYHDQEPINDVDSIPLTVGAKGNFLKALRIFAVSEISSERKQACQQHRLIDWYYFYHGFAALDWYRDAEFIEFVPDFKTTYQSLNHLTTDLRSYRMALTARLFRDDLDKFGSISFYGSRDSCLDEIYNPDTKLSSRDRILIKQYLVNQPLPLTLDKTEVNGNFSAHFGFQEHKLWTESLIHVVNETVFYQPKLHLTEKIFKPIAVMRPFVLVAAPGNLAYLKSYGFESFSDWIDESYDQEPDPERRLDLISKEIKKLCQLSKTDQERMLQDMRPVLEHNRNHFFGKFRDTITDELVENFDSCIRRWNNGRISGHFPVLPDLAAVKQSLLC